MGNLTEKISDIFGLQKEGEDMGTWYMRMMKRNLIVGVFVFGFFVIIILFAIMYSVVSSIFR